MLCPGLVIGSQRFFAQSELNRVSRLRVHQPQLPPHLGDQLHRGEDLHQDYFVAGGPQSGHGLLRQLLRQEVRKDDGYASGHRTSRRGDNAPFGSEAARQSGQGGPEAGRRALAPERPGPPDDAAGEADAGGSVIASQCQIGQGAGQASGRPFLPNGVPGH